MNTWFLTVTLIRLARVRSMLPHSSGQIQQVYGLFFFFYEISIGRSNSAVKRGWMLKTQGKKRNQTISAAHSVCARTAIAIKSGPTNWCCSEASLPNLSEKLHCWSDLKVVEWTDRWISQHENTRDSWDQWNGPALGCEFAHILVHQCTENQQTGRKR